MISKFFKILKSYGIFGFTRLVYNIILSKILFPSARIIRQPFYIREEGTIDFGKNFSSNAGLIIDVYGKDSKLIIGNNVTVNYNLHVGVCNEVKIGNNVLIASGVYISDHDHGSYGGKEHTSPLIPPNERKLNISSVEIGDDCWIGERVSILPGVKIGKGVILGTGTVVKSDLPDYVIAVGTPARIVKKFDFQINEWVKAK